METKHVYQNTKSKIMLKFINHINVVKLKFLCQNILRYFLQLGAELAGWKDKGGQQVGLDKGICVGFGKRRLR